MVGIDHYDAVMERYSWWFRGRRAIMGELLARYAGPGQRALEVGCGIGGNLPLLHRHSCAVVMDISPHSLRMVPPKVPRLLGDGTSLPFHSGTFDLVLAMDVVEHMEDDASGLREMARVARRRGIVAVSVPAHPRLWSRHDTVLGHRRRYTRSGLRQRLEAAELHILKLTHAVTSPLPAIIAYRHTLDRNGHHGLRPLPGPVEAALCLALAAEARAVRRCDLPFGLSLFAIARVPEGGKR